MASVTIEQLSGDDLVSLSAWLREREEYNRVYGIGEEKGESDRTKERLLAQHERDRGNDLEGEADKLRTALNDLVTFVTAQSERMITPSEVEGKLRTACDAAKQAIDAYDNSIHKAIPF